MKSRRQQEEITPNRLCADCRRTCKQPDFALISSCPRYYPFRKKKKAVKEWKQQELFSETSPKKPRKGQADATAHR